jgi:hypothetical protein
MTPKYNRIAGKNEIFRRVRILSLLVELEDERLKAFRLV